MIELVFEASNNRTYQITFESIYERYYHINFKVIKGELLSFSKRRDPDITNVTVSYDGSKIIWDHGTVNTGQFVTKKVIARCIPPDLKNKCNEILNKLYLI